MKLDKITARGVNNLYRHPETGVIYYRKYGEGFEVTRSCKTKDLELAKKEAAKISLEVFKTGRPKSRQRATALELYDMWTIRKEAMNKAPATIASIRATRKHLAPYLRVMMPEDITAEWWESVYIPEIRYKTHPKRKFMNDRKWLTAFLKQLAEDGAIDRAPKLQNPDVKEQVGKVFTDLEIRTMLTAAGDDLKLAIQMASTMGMRRLEIFHLQWDRVSLTERVIRLKAEDTKIRKARSFAISDPVWQALTLRAATPSRWVFPSTTGQDKPLDKDGFRKSWASVKRIAQATGRFHDLRHTFLTKAFKAEGANPALICWYAGLSLEVAQRVYLHFSEEDTKHVARLVTYG